MSTQTALKPDADAAPDAAPRRPVYAALLASLISRRTLRAVLLIVVIDVILRFALVIFAAITGADWLLPIMPGLAGGTAGALGALWLQRTIAAKYPAQRERRGGR